MFKKKVLIKNVWVCFIINMIWRNRSVEMNTQVGHYFSILVIYSIYLEENISGSENITDSSLNTICDCLGNISEPLNIKTTTLPSESTVCECPDNMTSTNVRTIANSSEPESTDIIQCYSCNGPNGMCDNVTGEGSSKNCSRNISTCSLAKMKDRITEEGSLIK